MKKNFLKKMTAIMLVAMMAVGMLGVASAADVTINNTDEGTHTYGAYQIFTGTLSTDADGKQVLTEIAWGTGVDSANLITALKAWTDSDSSTPFASLADDASAGDYAAAMGSVKDADGLAELIGNYVTTAISTDASVLTVEAAGYYLIKDTEAVTGYGAATAFILKVIDPSTNITVDVKNELPTLEKKIVDGENLVDSTTAQVGDTVSFQLKATVADDITAYDVYKMVFTDTITGSLTLDAASVKVSVDGTDVTAQLANTIVTADKSLTVTIADLKTLGVTVDADTEVLVTYNTIVTSVTNSGEIASNMASLEYSNDPTWEVGKDNDGDGTPDTSEDTPTGDTPDDETDVYSFTIKIDKVDESGANLANAIFVIQNEADKYLKVEGSTYTWVDSIDDATTYTSDATDAVITINGLDAGTYTVVEKSAPTGYNKADDIDVTLSAEAPEGGVVSYESQVTVINEKGSVLPSTGGMGTTILYIVGGILVVGAGVTLIVRKRMKNEAE